MFMRVSIYDSETKKKIVDQLYQIVDQLEN